MQTIHQSAYYAAHLHPRAGLIIESTRRAGGVQLKPDHSQFTSYVDGIKTAIDSREADALCRALMQ